jgi:hypothetical protein
MSRFLRVLRASACIISTNGHVGGGDLLRRREGAAQVVNQLAERPTPVAD